VRTIEQVLATRADYSSFLVHLTRKQEKLSARRVLKKILRETCLAARDAHCLFLRAIPDGAEEHFNVVCFTEAPLHQIKTFLGKIQGRNIELGPYGLVFTKEFISKQGGNPAFYVNTHHHRRLRDAATALFERAETEGFDDSDLTPLLPFINIFGKKQGGGRHDFYWEREWRVVGAVQFNKKDVVVGLCPADRVAEFEKEFKNIRFISPRWGLDAIITHLRL
jgi:Putative abortive phage resistance protein AbiGi, antitoxin